MNLKQQKQNNKRPQIKVCGLTRVEEALECAVLGADAIGCVFFPKSPRNLTQDQAKKITMAVRGKAKAIGVFVNESYDGIMQKVNYCGLHGVQLHGSETPEMVSRLVRENIIVIKALFAEGSPSLEQAENYQPSAYLVECGRGKLPGGNALEWDWGKMYGFGRRHAFVLAGGLDPENVCNAMKNSFPDAVDVSSGVESCPGRKDPEKVKLFINAVADCALNKNYSEETRSIF
jgi:phosphoribosylanthranilate isomerase